ncbi:hypothetical protein B1M_40083, partial [Burkholderia sp. TJI49]
MRETRAAAAPDSLIPAPPETLSIDFANTLYWRGTDTPTETFGSLDDLLAWCRERAGVPAWLAEACRARSADEGHGAALLARALALREALYRLFHAQAEQREPHPDDLALLGGFLGEASPRVAPARIDGGYAWRIDARNATLAGLLSPVLWSATDLLGGARLA